MNDEIKAIVEAELKAHAIKPSMRKFADWLMEGLTKDGDGVISHNTISNWRNGKLPSTDFLENILSVYPVSDRRFQFALKLLAVKSPHVWGKQGVVWNLKARLTK
jgi:transcriptional regulator with XRE-family HTH domain